MRKIRNIVAKFIVLMVGIMAMRELEKEVFLGHIRDQREQREQIMLDAILGTIFAMGILLSAVFLVWGCGG